VIDAFRTDAAGTSQAAVAGTVAAIDSQIERAGAGDSQAIFDLASNVSPRQMVRNVRTAMMRHAERGGSFQALENPGGEMADLAPGGAMPASQSFTTARAHRAGNQQVIIGGARWHVPKGANPSAFPKVDPVGDRLQEMSRDAASKWSSTSLSQAELQAIELARASNRPWQALRLERQARGRWVESEVRNAAASELPDLRWSRVGVDVVDPTTSLKYDILSGTQSNLDRHAKRMKDEQFRMIDF